MSQGKVIAITNRKGGVGKTTTALNLGVGLVKKSKKVLLADADSSADLTEWLRGENSKITLTDKLYDVVAGKDYDPKEGVISHNEGMDFLPSDRRLADSELTLARIPGREKVLRKYISEVRDSYDYIVIDCSPSLGLVTLNALVAADSVIIPVRSQYMPAKDMTKLMTFIFQVKRKINPGLNVEGILLTLVDKRTNLAKSTEETVRKNFGARVKVFDTRLPFAVKAAESAAAKKSIFTYAPSSPVASAYKALTEEVLNEPEKEKHRLRPSHIR